MKNLAVDAHSPLPAHAQIAEQIKLRCLEEQLRPGDAVPSIRQLAARLGVGTAIVRRAYRELCETGLLRTEGRRHAVGHPAAPPAENLVRAVADEAEQVLAWARMHEVSGVALARFILHRAFERERVSPSYAFVDACRLVAALAAKRVGRAWSVPVVPVPVRELSTFWSQSGRTLTRVLVNQYLYEEAAAIIGNADTRLVPIPVRPPERLSRRLRRTAPRATICLLCADQDDARLCQVMTRQIEDLQSGRHRVAVRTAAQIGNVRRFLEAPRRGLCLVSPSLWETLPAGIRRLTTLAPALTEPDPEAIEHARARAGVLL